jgi:hypothetical protein
MRKNMIENAAIEVAIQVRAVEDSIDLAITEIAELQSRMMRANTLASTRYGTIHPALQKIAAAVSALVDTRGAIVECHAALAEARGEVPGLRTVSFGDEGSCPPKTATSDLRIVA